MFHVLHRFYILTWTLLLLASAAWVYAKSGVSAGVSDWYSVWQNKPRPVTPAAEISGTVIKVIDGTSVNVQGADRQFYSIALQGAVPAAKSPPGGRSAKDPVKARLSELVLSNEVQVTLTSLDQRRRGVGVIYVGSTNVNAFMVESGLLKLNRDFIKPLPLLEQYALIRAERRANERTLAETAVTQ